LREILPRYYEEGSGDTKKTRQGRQQILDAFTELMGNPRLRDIDETLLREWRAILSATGGSLKSTKAVSPSTKTSYLITMKAFLSWAVSAGLIRKNPAKSKEFKGKTTVKVTRSQKFLSKEEREVLLSTPCRDYVGLILHLGFFTGMRDGEMLAMTPDWLWIAEDWSKGSITVQTTPITFTDGKNSWFVPKGKRARKIPIHPRLLAFLKNYGMRRPYLIAPDKPFWPTDDKKSKRFDSKRALASHGRKSGVENLAFHPLRHSFGTHLSMDGTPMNKIAELLGDTLSVTERHYIGFSPAVLSSLDSL
jgi:integrase